MEFFKAATTTINKDDVDNTRVIEGGGINVETVRNIVDKPLSRFTQATALAANSNDDVKEADNLMKDVQAESTAQQEQAQKGIMAAKTSTLTKGSMEAVRMFAASNKPSHDADNKESHDAGNDTVVIHTR